MAIDGSERYLRYILLLGDGILLCLRSIIRREVVRTGSTLEAILLIPQKRSQLESSCSSLSQRHRLFPSSSTVNANLESWDISLLTLVLQKVFWQNLSRNERVHIGYLRDCRNEFQGHPPAMSMDEPEYTTRSADIATVLQDLTSGMDQQIRDELTRIINKSNSVQFDFRASIQTLQQLYEFKEDMLQELEKRFQEVNTKLDDMQDKSTDHKQLTKCIETLQGHMHGDILEAKSLADKNNRIAKATSKTLDSVKADVSRSREFDEQNQEMLRNIEQMINALMSQQRVQTKFQQDVDTNINVNSERPENAAEAQGIIVSTINDILKHIRPDMMEDSETAEAIMESVNDVLTREEGNDYELTKALLQLIRDILRHGHIHQARKGSIKLTIGFTSYSRILQFMQYLNSTKFHKCLKDISRTLENRTGHAVTLSANIAQESLLDLHEHLANECNMLKRKRTVVLPVQCKGIKDLNHIWKLLQSGGADRHMERISEILTKILGGNVTVTTSVNLKQFEQALLKSGTDRHPVGMDTYPLESVLDEEEPKKCTEELDLDTHVYVTREGIVFYNQLYEKTTTEVDEVPVLPVHRSKEFRIERDGKDQDQELISMDDGNEMSIESWHSEMKKLDDAEGLDEEDNITPFRPTKKYSAMYKIDTEIPFISGIKLLPNNGVLINDWNNKRLKMLDCSLDLVSDYDLPEYSWDVCYIENGTAAVVCFGRNNILLIDVSDFKKSGREVEFDHNCCGLACYKNTLYIVDDTSRVYSYKATTNLILNNVFTTTQVKSKILYRHIVVSDDGEMIYITSGNIGLVTIDNKGNRMSILKPDTLWEPCDVCVVGDGTVLVCELSSNDVLQVDYGGKSVLKKVVTLTPELQPCAMCFDRQNSRLLVGGDNKDVQAIELQKI